MHAVKPGVFQSSSMSIPFFFSDLSNLRNVHKLIVVGIGSNAQTYAFKDAARQVGNLISSSPASVIDVGSPVYLSSTKSQLNREICT